MFKQFYKDIDTLHQLVLPLRMEMAMSKMADTLQGLANSIGSVIAPLILANIEAGKLADALND